MSKTLVAQKAGRYASFPTLVCDAGNLVLFYRDGATEKLGTHGKAGRVLSLTIPVARFLDAFDRGLDLTDLAEPVLCFAEQNEMDAIVSNLGNLGFSLATRYFDENRKMHSFSSFSTSTRFPSRTKVSLPEIEWFCFYGHAFVHQGQSLHPAYGALKSDGVHRPFLLRHEGNGRFALHAQLESEFGKVRLNESSHAFYRGEHQLFMRMDRPPFGIWHAHSADTREWSKPELLFENAHAPMAYCTEDRLFLSFRHILSEEKAAIGICEPLANGEIHDLDFYEGGIYDGGYSDLCRIGTRLFVFYYLGNKTGEPCIKVTEFRDRSS